MLKTKLWDQNIAFGSNSMDMLCVYLVSRWSGGRWWGLKDVYARSLADLVNMYQSQHFELELTK
jgi:hypothetical protein